jgi:ATP-binding cassette subfamily B protein
MTKPQEPTSLLGEFANMLRQGWQVWRQVSWPRRRAFLLAAGLMLTAGLLDTSVFLWLGGLVDAMQGKPSDQFWKGVPLLLSGAETTASAPGRSDQLRIAAVFLALISVAYAVKEALQVLRRYLVEANCSQIEKETMVHLVDHLLHVDLSRLSADRVGALHGRIHRSVEGFIKFFKLAFMDFLPAVSLALFALGAVTFSQPFVALVMAGCIPVSLLLTFRQIASQKGIRLELIRKREGLDGTVVEQLGGIEYIRAANTLPLEVARVQRAAEERRAMQIRHHVTMSLFDAAKSLNEGLFYIGMVAISVHLAVNGQITVGDIVTFSALYLRVMGPLREIHRILDEGHESSLRVATLMRMMNEPLDHSFQLPTIRRPRFAPGAPIIVAQDLVLDYQTPEGRAKRALDRVSLVVHGGETIGAAGPSGSGKSSWLKVVMRLVHPTGGSVTLGGEPLEAISREVIGDTIGYVSQTPFVFAGTVAENIAYGIPGATQEQIEEAAKRAYLHDEIMEMPAGYQTLLTERGQNLSGGQRQRIALARVFLRNPPLLILDEATSALDNISERRIQQAISEARKDRTVIMVAHRLTTLRDADRIFVFDQGRIAETGTYEELIERGGVFTELVRSANDGAFAKA